MSPPRSLVWLAVALLSASSAGARAAAPLPRTLAVEAGPAAVLVSLSCPDPAPQLALAVDQRAALPLRRTTLGEAPTALALVLDVSAPMRGPGTPHSTALRDAAQLAGLLLAIAHPAAPVALVTFDGQARVALPLSADRAAARAALERLEAAPPGVGQAGALAAALQLAAGQLEAAPGPQAIVAFVAAAAPHAQAPATGGLAVRMLIIGHGAAAPAEQRPGASDLANAAEGLGAGYVPYQSADIAALPTLHQALQARFRALLAPGERLRLELPAVGPGPHLLEVEGCGAPLVGAFAGPEAPLAVPLAATALLTGALAGAAFGRRQAGRRPPPRLPATVTTTEARRKAAIDLTTARRAAGPVSAAGLRAVLWDGGRRRTFSLEGRHWTLGSDPGCAIMVDGEGIAPLHARLSAAGEGLTLTALESGGGTRLGAFGRPLAPGVPEALDEGELVMLGQTVRLMVERACAAPEEGL